MIWFTKIAASRLGCVRCSRRRGGVGLLLWLQLVLVVEVAVVVMVGCGGGVPRQVLSAGGAALRTAGVQAGHRPCELSAVQLARRWSHHRTAPAPLIVTTHAEHPWN